MNARLLTRDFSYHFITTISQRADVITATDNDPAVQTNALRWKIAAAAESERAASRIAPMMALLDSWALARQMREFLADGRGSTLFGAQQEAAAGVAIELDEEAESLARELIAHNEFAKYEQFVATYTREHPLLTLDFVRPSVMELWSQTQGANISLVDSAGTIPQAMSDLSDRMKMSSDALALQAMWRTQLALREAGYSGGDIRAALQQLDERLNEVSTAAESAPHLVKDAVAEVRRSVLDVLERVDSSSASLIEALRGERQALAVDVRTEREALVVAADAQRKAIAVDAAKIADQAVKSAGEQVRYLAREVLLLLILLALLLLGLPFAAGYLVGRARATRAGRP